MRKTATVREVISAVETRIERFKAERDRLGDDQFYRENPGANSMMEVFYQDLETLERWSPDKKLDVSYKCGGSGWCEYFGDDFAVKQVESSDIDSLLGGLDE